MNEVELTRVIMAHPTECPHSLTDILTCLDKSVSNYEMIDVIRILRVARESLLIVENTHGMYEVVK